MLPPSRACALEFHDSTVKCVNTAANTTEITFSSAFIHIPREGSESYIADVYLFPIVLTCTEVDNLEGWVPKNDIELSDATVVVSGTLYPNMLPIPCDHAGVIELSLLFTNSERLNIRAKGLRGQPVGAGRWIEIFTE